MSLTRIARRMIAALRSTDLNDFPSSLMGQAGRVPRVKATEDGYELVSVSGGGSSAVGVNRGTGAGVYTDNFGSALRFRTLKGGTNVNISTTADEITFDATTGEVNTASNRGTGVGVFKSKTGADLQFRSLTGANGITVTNADDEILLSYTGGDSALPWVSVKSCGAIGDGVADDTAAVAAALAILAGIGGGVLYFPAGIYKLTERVVLPADKNFTVRGDGMEISILNWTTANGGIYWNAWTFGRFRTLNVEGLSLTTSVPSGGTALQCGDGSTVIESAITIRNVAITNYQGVHESGAGYWGRGVYVYGLRFVTIDNVRIWGKSGLSTAHESTEGIYIHASTTGPQFGFNLSNIWVTCFQYGVRVRGYAEGLYIANGEIWGCRHCIYVDRTGADMAGAIFVKNVHLNAWENCVAVTYASAVNIEGCDLFHGASPVSGGPLSGQLLKLTSCQDIQIVGNKIQSAYAAPSEVIGIRLEAVYSGSITGNLISGTKTAGILAATGTTNILISGNPFVTGAASNIGVGIRCLSGSSNVHADANFMGTGVAQAWVDEGTNNSFGTRGALVSKTGGNQSIGPNTFTKVTYDTVNYDKGGWWDSVNQRFVVPAGVNFVKIKVTNWLSGQGTPCGYAYRVKKNGVFVAGLPHGSFHGDSAAFTGSSCTIQVAPGDYFEIEVSHAGSGNLLIQSSGATWASIEAVQ